MPAKYAFFTDQSHRFDSVYAGKRADFLRKNFDFIPGVLTSEKLDTAANGFPDIEVVFTTWGMPELRPDQLAKLPSLKALFYAAGSVKNFAAPLLDAGVTVCSAWTANAIPVAEFVVGHTLLACKGFFRNSTALSGASPTEWSQQAPHGPGIYGQRVAFLGLGAIAQKTIELLSPYALEVVPVASRAERREVSLEDAFRTCLVVSNHLPDRADNRGILNADLFRLLPRGATFINTGRGAQVNEADLIKVWSERPDLTAILDVTSPEPPALDSPLRQMPNVHLSSHIAGSICDEIYRMTELMMAEHNRWLAGQALENEVTREVFQSMA
jgi:phosphoglycerate dehydrogenase-like enzyme